MPITGGTQEVAFFWTESGGTTCFPLSQGSNGATAFAVNHNGSVVSVVGDVNLSLGGSRATLWKVK